MRDRVKREGASAPQRSVTGPDCGGGEGFGRERRAGKRGERGESGEGARRITDHSSTCTPHTNAFMYKAPCAASARRTARGEWA